MAEEEKVIHMKGFPAALHREAKIQAVVEGVTLKEIIIKALTEYLEGRKGGGR